MATVDLLSAIVLMYRVFIVFSVTGTLNGGGGTSAGQPGEIHEQSGAGCIHHVFLGVNAYRRQQYQKAEQIINLAGRLCSPAETNIQMQWYANKVVACLVALHREKSDFQKGDIHEALEYFRKQDCTCLLAETYMAAF